MRRSCGYLRVIGSATRTITRCLPKGRNVLNVTRPAEVAHDWLGSKCVYWLLCGIGGFQEVGNDCFVGDWGCLWIVRLMRRAILLAASVAGMAFVLIFVWYMGTSTWRLLWRGCDGKIFSFGTLKYFAFCEICKFDDPAGLLSETSKNDEMIIPHNIKDSCLCLILHNDIEIDASEYDKTKTKLDIFIELSTM